MGEIIVTWWLLVLPSNQLLLSEPPIPSLPQVEVYYSEKDCSAKLNEIRLVRRDAYCTPLGAIEREGE